ncbi:MAG: hypothetical protein ACYDEO_22990 [Aggregatilineales bacterium]
MALQHFSLYLDDEDPDDISLIRYLNRYKPKRKVSNELRNAMLTYLAALKTGTARPTVSAPMAYTAAEAANVFQPSPPSVLPNGTQAGFSKAIQEARRTFRR